MKAKDLSIIKGYEGLRLKAYQDSVGVWTIGYGHTKGVSSGMEINETQADTFLREDVSWAQDAVNDNVSVPLNQLQFDALVSFTFNLGETNLKSSTLLRKLNSGDYLGAANEFQRWNKAGGKELSGLTKRRNAEANQFISAPFESQP